MSEFNRQKLDELLKNASPHEHDLTEEEMDFVIQSRDEIYQNALKKASKFFLLSFLILVAYKLLEKFTGATIMGKFVTITVAATVGITPVVVNKVIDYHTQKTQKEPIIIEEKIEPVKKKEHARLVIAFQNVSIQSKTLSALQLAEFKKIIYNYLYSHNQKNYELSIAIDKNKITEKYYVSFSLKDKTTSGGLVDISKELNSYTEALSVCRTIAKDIHAKHIK